MYKPSTGRLERRHTHTIEENEKRSPFDRDHDRILYSSAFRRLGGATQTITPSESQFFHNRLTHSIKVATLARRIAEMILRSKNYRPSELNSLGGLDPSVVEAAALAHDLGNPPFGHIAEKALDELVMQAGKDEGIDFIDGFEGNAQSFRIVNKLSYGYSNCCGLNLTRGTLNAILKYPWLRDSIPSNHHGKFGVYKSEEGEFNWTRKYCKNFGENYRTLEACIMDLADDITYAVHDLEDFYRANIIPLVNVWERINRTSLFDIIKNTQEIWFPKNPDIDPEKHVADFLRFVKSFPIEMTFEGRHDQRVGIHLLCSQMIKRVLRGITINCKLDEFPSPIILDEHAAVEILILKYLTKSFVINHPNLKRQQHGQIEIVKYIFNTLRKNIDCRDDLVLFPMSEQEQLVKLIGKNDPGSKYEKIRLLADAVSYLTDIEAYDLYEKLSGHSVGSLFDYTHI